MADIEKNYESLTERLGPPDQRQDMPDEELSYCKGRLPSRLIQFMGDQGYSTYRSGGVTIAKPATLAPILALVFKADPNLSHENCTVVSYSPFGSLSLWSDELGIAYVDLAEGRVSLRKLAPTEFRPGMLPPKPKSPPDTNLVAREAVLSYPEDFDFLDYRGDEMLRRCITQHGEISLRECYGFFSALALAGVDSPMRSVEHIRRVSALEHFALLAQAQPF